MSAPAYILEHDNEQVLLLMKRVGLTHAEAIDQYIEMLQAYLSAARHPRTRLGFKQRIVHLGGLTTAMRKRRPNPMTLSVKGRRVRVHSLGKGIRFPQRAWSSEAAILAHSLKQAKRIHRTYGEAWKNPSHPRPTRVTPLKSKSTAEYAISRVTDGRGDKLFYVRFISGPHAGHSGNAYVLGDLLDWVGKMGYRVRGAQSNPVRRLSKRQGVRRERKKWRSLSKADRKRIHREETVEVRDIYRNPRRPNPESKLPRTCPVGRLQELNLRGRSDANRIALKAGRRWDDDTIIKVFTDRKVMAVTVRMQQRSGPDGVPKWVPIIPLSDSEGYYR